MSDDANPISTVSDDVVFGRQLPTAEDLEAILQLVSSAVNKREVNPYRPSYPDDPRRIVTPAELKAEELWRPRFARYNGQRRRGVPRQFWAANLTEADQTPLIHRARRYVDDEFPKGRAVAFLSPTGRGKTYAAAGILAALKDGRFIHAVDLARRLQDFDTQEAAFAEAIEATVLVVDDVGSEYLKEGGMTEALFSQIVWKREAELLPMIITSNLTPDAFKARVGDRAFDRLTGDTWGSIFLDKGPSRRQVKTVKKAVA